MKKDKLNPWDKAAKRVLIRPNTLDMMAPDGMIHPVLVPGARPCKLERGVNYFVLALEKMGCRTLFSCEGHPRGFYIYFTASYELAVDINRAGYFTVDIDPHFNRFVIRLYHVRTEKRRCEILRSAAESWEKRLSFRWKKPPKEVTETAVKRKKVKRVRS